MACERDRLATLAATQSLTLEAALTLLGETCLDIHLNGQTFWSAVPVNVWTYTLGGYQVPKKWLSYRELPLLGRPLHPEESDYFAPGRPPHRRHPPPRPRPRRQLRRHPSHSHRPPT